MSFLWFVAVPYLAIVMAIMVGVYRYYNDRFSYSTLSSQFLEKRALFWGSVPWHYGVILVLLAHLLAFIVPGFWQDLIANETRLYVLEVTGIALALLSVMGLTILIVRRMTNPKAFINATGWDWLLLVALLVQVGLGFYVALFYRWGSDWFLHTASPWLVSLLKFQPDTRYVTALPLPIQIHMVGGFVLLGILSFTRLVLVLAFPVTYLWRPYQVVIFNRRPTR